MQIVRLYLCQRFYGGSTGAHCKDLKLGNNFMFAVRPRLLPKKTSIKQPYRAHQFLRKKKLRQNVFRQNVNLALPTGNRKLSDTFGWKLSEIFLRVGSCLTTSSFRVGSCQTVSWSCLTTSSFRVGSCQTVSWSCLTTSSFRVGSC